MVASPLVETKLFCPQPRAEAIARPRLLELLDPGRRARLTLVSAPAGFGKTTLVTSWLSALADQGVETAWVSLDERDRDPEGVQ